MMQPKELRSRRIAVGWSPAKLAAALGVRADDIHAWETGERPIEAPKALDQVLRGAARKT